MRAVLATISIMFLLPGCAAYQDWEYRTANGMRSELAWADYTKNPLRIACPSDYGHGWKEGYLCVATGGSGHPPSVPPRQYWHPKYQSCKGQEAVAAWYAGFQEGAASAARAGVGQYHYLRPPGTQCHNPPDLHDSGTHDFSAAQTPPMSQVAAPPADLYPPAMAPETLPPGAGRNMNTSPIDASPSDQRFELPPANTVPNPGGPMFEAPFGPQAKLMPPVDLTVERLPVCNDSDTTRKIY